MIRELRVRLANVQAELNGAMKLLAKMEGQDTHYISDPTIRKALQSGHDCGYLIVEDTTFQEES